MYEGLKLYTTMGISYKIVSGTQTLTRGNEVWVPENTYNNVLMDYVLEVKACNYMYILPLSVC